MNGLGYLTAAYSAVWLILAYFITSLLLKNRRLLRELSQIEQRVKTLENR